MARTNSKGRSKGERFVQLHEWILNCPAYRGLSCYARCLHTELHRRFNGTNNGDIVMSVRQAAALLNCNKDTANNAFKELEAKGFIRPNQKGAFDHKARHATTWILAEKAHNGELATKDFMRWRPGGEIQNTVLPFRTLGPIKPDRGQA